MLPVEAAARRAASASKARLAEGAGGASDHLALVTAFNGWVAARQAGGRRDRVFCAEHFLSSATMQMVEGMRHQLLGELKVGWRVNTVWYVCRRAICWAWTSTSQLQMVDSLRHQLLGRDVCTNPVCSLLRPALPLQRYHAHVK